MSVRVMKEVGGARVWGGVWGYMRTSIDCSPLEEVVDSVRGGETPTKQGDW